MNQVIREIVERYWRDGLSIGESIAAVYRMRRIRLTFEIVHEVYVSLANRAREFEWRSHPTS